MVSTWYLYGMPLLGELWPHDITLGKTGLASSATETWYTDD